MLNGARNLRRGFASMARDFLLGLEFAPPPRQFFAPSAATLLVLLNHNWISRPIGAL
jgi:hypothetical protein